MGGTEHLLGFYRQEEVATLVALLPSPRIANVTGAIANDGGVGETS